MLSENEKKQIKTQIAANQHELYVISLEEMDAIVSASATGPKSHLKALWSEVKSELEFSAGYYASGKDVVTLSKLIGDLGGVGVKAYVKSYGGKPHIILKGNPALRRVLTGTKYGVNNAKIIAMGLGKNGAIQSARAGGVLTIVLMTGYRITEYFLTDQSTLAHLIGYLATDVVKVGIATAASIAAAGVGSAIFTVAIGPLAAAIFVGVFVSYTLGKIDTHYGLSEQVVNVLEEMSDDVGDYINRKIAQAKRTGWEFAGSVIDYAADTVKVIVINTARHQLRRLGSPRTY